LSYSTVRNNDWATTIAFIRCGPILEMAGDSKSAIAEFRAAAERATNLREQHYLITNAARLATELGGR
jgi:hypothetical protein